MAEECAVQSCFIASTAALRFALAAHHLNYNLGYWILSHHDCNQFVYFVFETPDDEGSLDVSKLSSLLLDVNDLSTIYLRGFVEHSNLITMTTQLWYSEIMVFHGAGNVKLNQQCVIIPAMESSFDNTFHQHYEYDLSWKLHWWISENDPLHVEEYYNCF